MASSLFLFVFLFQIASGYPFLLLFLFWNALSPFSSESVTLSLLAGISFGMFLGNFERWILLTFITFALAQFLNRYVIRKRTPLTLSLLLFIITILWHAFGGGWSVKETLFMYMVFSFLFFFVYALGNKKTIRYQKRLF